ncbi:hypothetical protein F7725_025328 [Dissostichus mawsoni]|uniref:Uncharacterized protein n=1 Tax=Dissostichus mawsoni TaxID=36200 RepID=A0A7J5XAU4_DISMA|nr:hypothetical protein F7725_025328 [Dissostichus mawsoni]
MAQVPTCTLTFGTSYRSQLESRLASLGLMSSLGFPPGINWVSLASPWAKPDKYNSLLSPLDPHASYATRPLHGTSVPPAENGPRSLPSVSIFGALSSPVSRCANCVAELGGKLPFCTDGSVFSKQAGSGAVTDAVWMGRILRSQSNTAT